MGILAFGREDAPSTWRRADVAEHAEPADSRAAGHAQFSMVQSRVRTPRSNKHVKATNPRPCFRRDRSVSVRGFAPYVWR